MDLTCFYLGTLLPTLSLSSLVLILPPCPSISSSQPLSVSPSRRPCLPLLSPCPISHVLSLLSFPSPEAQRSHCTGKGGLRYRHYGFQLSFTSSRTQAYPALRSQVSFSMVASFSEDIPHIHIILGGRLSLKLLQGERTQTGLRFPQTDSV